MTDPQTHITGDPQGPIITGPVGQIGDRTIDTSGAPYEGDLHTGGGDVFTGNKYVFTGTAEEVRRLRNRQVMVEQVYVFWVKGVLQDSLYENVLIALNLEDRARAVAQRPWDMVVHLPDREDRLLPQGARIFDVYRQMNSRMLILGEPGAGKTTMLLQLVKEMIEGRQHPMEPIPVLFNLSSWAEKQAPLEEWLVEELSRNYNVSKNQGRAWVENDDLSLFLDGLDEVRAEVRAQCVQAINAFREHRASVAVCVCCRRQEYEALPIQLALNGAVLLGSLTPEQVDAYLEGLGPAAGGLRAALQQDAGLQELAESPLMVNIMLMAYQGKKPAAVDLGDTAEERKRHLFDAYIDRMFQRRVRTKLALYPCGDMIRWLSWLARSLVDHSHTVFLIEQLQPSWAQSQTKSRSISITACILMWGPLYGVSVGLIGGLLYGLVYLLLGASLYGLHSGLLEGPRSGLLFGLGGGLSVGLIGGLIDGFSGGWRAITSGEQSGSLWSRIRSSLYFALFWEGLSDSCSGCFMY
jgi:eukaryotic-like serine/threonine-protein kinase